MACAKCDENIFDEKCDIKKDCREDMMIATVDCKPDKRRRKNRYRQYAATFTLVGRSSNGLFDVTNGLEGDQIQVHGTNLCLHREKTRAILLKQCNASEPNQRFLGFRTGGQEMELLPFPGTFSKNGIQFERCITQHHHPRQGERIFAETCEKSRKTDTSKWSTL